MHTHVTCLPQRDRDKEVTSHLDEENSRLRHQMCALALNTDVANRYWWTDTCNNKQQDAYVVYTSYIC